jgi:His/Glu/Gln/Arg/opine family amino acid ABC transporter permease subunit
MAGLKVTLEITIATFVIGVIVGAALTACRLSRWRALRVVATIYIDTVRSIPTLVILFLVYYSLGQFGLNFSGMMAAIWGLGFYYASLFAEIFRAGIQSVGQGQREAALALGIKRRTLVMKVLLPQALLYVLAPTTNQVSNIIKDTSLVVTIGVADLMSQAYTAGSQTFLPMDMLVLAGILYLIVYFILTQVLVRWEANVQRRRS